MLCPKCDYEQADILTETGLRSYDHLLAGLAVTIGVIIFIMSYAWGALLLWRQYRKLADE